MGEANRRGTFVERRERALAQEREIKALRGLKDLFGAVLREQGRIRVSKRDLAAIGDYAIRVKQDDECFMLSFEGETEPAG